MITRDFSWSKGGRCRDVKKIRGLNLFGIPWATSACCGLSFTFIITGVRKIFIKLRRGAVTKDVFKYSQRISVSVLSKQTTQKPLRNTRCFKPLPLNEDDP